MSWPHDPTQDERDAYTQGYYDGSWDTFTKIEKHTASRRDALNGYTDKSWSRLITRKIRQLQYSFRKATE